jgi:hypothetical protein
MSSTVPADRIIAAIGEAAPSLIKDVRPLIAAYAVSAWADWDFDGCFIDDNGRRFELLTDGKLTSAAAVERTVPTPAEMSAGWGPTLTEGHRLSIKEESKGFCWIVAREPLRSSRLQRWAMRIDENSGSWHLWFGLTGFDAAAVRALPKADNRNGRVVSNPHTVSYCTNSVWYDSRTRAQIDYAQSGTHSHYQFLPWTARHIRDYHEIAGAVLVMNIDRATNCLQMQWDGPRGPSLPQLCVLPADYPLGEVRPCMLLWGPTTRLTELLAPDVFPLPSDTQK